MEEMNDEPDVAEEIEREKEIQRIMREWAVSRGNAVHIYALEGGETPTTEVADEHFDEYLKSRKRKVPKPDNGPS